MASGIPIPGLRRWIEYLVAILLGNAIYYSLLSPHLPGVLRHDQFGMLVDLGVCAGVYWLYRLGLKVTAPKEL